MLKKVLFILFFAAALVWINPVPGDIVGTDNIAYAQSEGNLPESVCDDTVTSEKRNCTLAERIVDRDGFVYTSWVVVRGTINILLIIALLVISFSNITRISIDTYTIKKALPNLLIGVILANASLFIVRYMADIATVTTYFFVEQVSLVSFAKFLSITVSVIGINSISAVAGVGAIGILLGIIIILIAIIGILWLAFILYIRLLAIYLLTIVSPLAFVSYGIPGLEKFFKQWWQQFTKWLFILPAMSAIFWLIIVIGTQPTEVDGVIGRALTTNPSIGLTIILYVLFFFALTIPSKFGGAIVDKATNLFKKNPISEAVVDNANILAHKTPLLGTAIKGLQYGKLARKLRLENAQKGAEGRALKSRWARGYLRAGEGGEAKVVGDKFDAAEAEGQKKALDEGKLSTALHKALKKDPLSVRLIKSEYEKGKNEADRDLQLARNKLMHLTADENQGELSRTFDKMNESSALTNEFGKNEGIAKGNLAKEELILSKHAGNWEKAKNAGNDTLAAQLEKDYDRIIDKNKNGHEFFSGLSIEDAAKATGVNQSIIKAKKSQSAKAVEAGVKAINEEPLKNETMEEALEKYRSIGDLDKLIKGDTLGVDMKDQFFFSAHTNKLTYWAGRRNDHRRDPALMELSKMTAQGTGGVTIGNQSFIRDPSGNIDTAAIENKVKGLSDKDKLALFRDIADKNQFAVGSGAYQSGHHIS